MGEDSMSNKSRIFLLEDDEVDRSILEAFCKKSNWLVKSFDDPFKLIEELKDAKNHDAIVVSDISMPTMSGFQFLEKAQFEGLQHPVVFVTGHQDISNSIRALRMGAKDFFTKPIDFDLFHARMNNILIELKKVKSLEEDNLSLLKSHTVAGLVGESQSMQEVYRKIRLFSEYDSTVLIVGESGVGKSRIARSIHELSRRSKADFIQVNCASIPETLLESEFFGHQKGAFTGADRDRPGLFEAAQNGTLFLDEIGEVPLHLQAKLLKVIQDKEVRRVGSNIGIPLNVRIVCATNINLEGAIRKKKFREDLYYRINVLPIEIPPLRDRPGDIEILARNIVHRNEVQWGEKRRLTNSSMRKLQDYDWPGNVRELENVLERAYILSESDEIEIESIGSGDREAGPQHLFNLGQSLPTLKELELAYIREVLRRASTKDEAAKLLGIGRKTLYRKEADL